jgi:hypothetical protein
MAKKLFAFWGDERESHFFALLPHDMPDENAAALAKAATSDANREQDANPAPGCNDGLCVEDSIKARLTPLGFEFVKKPAGFEYWEDLRQDETVLEARLRLAGFSVTKDGTGNLTVATSYGPVVLDLKNSSWESMGTKGGLSPIGIDNLLFLLQAREESFAIR